MSREWITLTPVATSQEVSALGERIETVGQPIRMLAFAKDIGGPELEENQVILKTGDTEFTVALRPAIEGINQDWRLRARNADWEIIRTIRRSAPGGIGNREVVIRAKVNR